MLKNAVTDHRNPPGGLTDLAVILQGLAEGVTVQDETGRLVFANQAAAHSMGYPSVEALIAVPVDEVVSQYDLMDETGRPFPRENLPGRLALRGIEPPKTLLRVRERKTGQERWSVIQATPIFDGQGRVRLAVNIWHDITERKRAEQTLKASEERFRSLSEASFEGIALHEQGRIVDLNTTLAKMFGCDRAELLGKNVLDLLSRDGRNGGRGPLIENEQPVEATAFRRDGQPFPVEIIGKQLGGSETSTAVMAIRDLTERKMLEEQVRQSQKMEAVGRLAGGVAHDFNNILTAIKGYSELLLEGLGANTKGHRYADQVHRAAVRAQALVDQLLAFGRKQENRPEALSLSTIVSGFANLLECLVGEPIQVVFDLVADAGSVRADAGQMEQVLLNLVLNARDAMAEGGQLYISTRNVELTEETVRGRLGVRPGPYVCLTVRDTGTGMDEETRARAFEPFFTTKELGKGTGLGLAAVYGIVQQSGGHIQLTSASRQGTTVEIFLPALDSPTSALPKSPPAAPRSRPERAAPRSRPARRRRS